MKRKKKEPIRCIAYLSAEDEPFRIATSENKQLRYMYEYAKAHNLKISKVLRRNGMSQEVVNRHWKKMIASITKDEAEGIFLVNMQAVSLSVADAYLKVGQVSEAGGVVITVDEGQLGMPIRRMIEGRMVLVNERI